MMTANARHRVSISLPSLLIGLVLFAAAIQPAVAQSLSRIYKDEFNNYTIWLGLHEDQTAVATLLYDEYYEAYERDYLETIRAFYDEAQTARRNPAHPNITSLEDQKTLREEFEDLTAKCQAADAEFLEKLEATLNPDQVKRMDRVRRGRQRVVWKTSRAELPEGNVDIVQLLNGFQFDAETTVEVERFISEFEPRFLNALIASHRSGFESRRRYFTEAMLLRRQLDAEYGTVSESEWAERMARIDDLRERGGRINFPPKKRLRDVIQEAFRQLMNLLPEDTAAELRRQYLHLSYPEIDPDATSASALYDAAEAIETLTPEQQANLTIVRSLFENQHERISRQMRESDMRRREASHRAKPRDPAKPGTNEWKLRVELGLEREALNEKQGAAIRAVLDLEQAKLLPEWDFTENPRPRVWDPKWRPKRDRSR